MTGYIVTIITLLVIVWDIDGAEINAASIMSAFVLSYNLLLHWPVLFINLGIAVKEASMEVFQFANDWAGTGLDDYSLGVHNIIDLFAALFNWVNPWWWVEEDDGYKWDKMYE